MQRPESAGDYFGHGGNKSMTAHKGAGANSPYKNFKGSKKQLGNSRNNRPQSAGAGTSSRRIDKQQAQKFGVEKPLHVALFDYDKKKMVKSSFATEEKGGVDASKQPPVPITINVNRKLMQNLRTEQDFANNKPVFINDSPPGE